MVKSIKKNLKVNNDGSASIVLFLLLVIFFSFSVFLSLDLQEGIIPDESAHFIFSQYYSTTLGIPEDSQTTYVHGWYTKQNPFLYYWINGRALNALELFLPNSSEWRQLVFLRILNALYSLGTVIFCYLLSKELIKHKWWQMLPVFLLTNTLMFVFLSGGVNYDNLANLFSMAGLYFLVRILKNEDYLSNSLGWMLSICLGTLVKYPILPLALATGVLWLIFTLRRRKNLFPLHFKGVRQIIAGLVLLIVIITNLGIYGVNLLKFQSVTPDCLDILSKDQCEVSPYTTRSNEIGLDHKLSILESIELGYPNPIEYVIDNWFPNMLYRIYGILGHLSYFPSHIIVLYRLLFLWIILLAVRYIKQSSFLFIGLGSTFVFYMLVLLYTNYNSELAYGFKNIAMQGRYIFPVIGIAYVGISYVLWNVPNKIIRNLSLAATIILFLVGGPIKFITHNQTIFKDWFIR